MFPRPTPPAHRASKLIAYIGQAIADLPESLLPEDDERELKTSSLLASRKKSHSLREVTTFRTAQQLAQQAVEMSAPALGRATKPSLLRCAKRLSPTRQHR